MNTRSTGSMQRMAAVLPFCAVVACTGQLKSEGHPPPGAAAAVSSKAAAAAGASAPGNSVASQVPSGGAPSESAGKLVMRRLSYAEYDRMLADLLGDTSAPAEGGNAWSPDAPNAVGYVAPTSAADLQVNLYNQTADSVVDNAFKALAAGKPAGKLAIPCASTPANAADETACATQLISDFGLHAYRRPVAAEEQTDLLALFSKVRGLGLNFTDSLAAVVKGMLQSPSFLYHWEIGPTPPLPAADGLVPLTSWQLASRLASSLWMTLPDDVLLQAAQANKLNTPADVAAQVARMLADPRAENGLFSFHAQWLFNFGSQGRDLTALLVKSDPRFTPAAAQGVQAEFTQFIASIYRGEGTLQSLFTAPYSFVNHDLGAIYGVDGPATGYAKVSLDPMQRGGIFTQTAFLATLANDGADNPVYRGLSIYLKVLCGTVGSPPANVPAVTFKANGTTRQSYDAHGNSACAKGCHDLFDPPGFAFENYDGIGAYRTTEAGQAVDATGTMLTPGNTQISFRNAIDLSQQLAQSSEAQTCMGRQWARYMLGREEAADDAGSMAMAFQRAAATPGFSVRELMSALFASKAFMYRRPSVGEGL